MLVVIILVACYYLNAPRQDREQARSYTETVTSTNGRKISFEMAAIASGTFVMGSPKSEPGSKNDERPQHEVQVEPFYLCTTETTIELFLVYYQETTSTITEVTGDEQNSDDIDAITGPTPVYGDMTMGYPDKHPAMGMTWHNAKTFCEWLSKKTGRTYRLPTEAEWEYACRAGGGDIFCCGNDPNQLVDFAWYEADADGETHEVAQKKPNTWGLYDMPGNVREWVEDFYDPQGYSGDSGKGATVDSPKPADGKVHVARGGDFDSSAEELRSAARAFEEEWWRFGDPQIPKSRWWLPQMDCIGFRVARSIDSDSKIVKEQKHARK